jgi:hypothetical protein
MNHTVSERDNSEKETPQNLCSGDEVGAGCHVIEVQLRELRQLFDSLDPSPFREKDLERNAEQYIVDSLKEHPSRTPSALVISLEQSTVRPDEGRVVGDAIRAHFARQSQRLRRELRQLLRRGVISLAIGVSFLVVFFFIGQVLVQWRGEGDVTKLLREGLIIGGWVAMWKPLEIFLYDWWPIVGERRVHDRLSRMKVLLVYNGSDQRPTQ